MFFLNKASKHLCYTVYIKFVSLLIKIKYFTAGQKKKIYPLYNVSISSFNLLTDYWGMERREEGPDVLLNSQVTS